MKRYTYFFCRNLRSKFLDFVKMSEYNEATVTLLVKSFLYRRKSGNKKEILFWDRDKYFTVHSNIIDSKKLFIFFKYLFKD